MQTRVINTSPSAANVIPNTEYTAALKQYLEVTRTSLTGDESALKIEPNDGKAYNITFYDTATSGFISAVAVVTEVFEAFIKIKYITGLDKICPCSYKDILVKFIDCKEATVNIGYISDISEYIIEKPKSTYKEVDKVALLGITSELIQSVVVRLRLYDDGGCCDITGANIVDMKVGGHYQVDYLDHNDHTMYQVCGILKSISIVPESGDETATTGFIRRETRTCNHHNQVGMGNTVYDDFEDIKEVLGTEHFLSLAKDKPENIMFIFDTSIDYQSSIDRVMLVDIRNVEMVEDVEFELKQDPTDPPNLGELDDVPECLGTCCHHSIEVCGACAKHGQCCNFTQCGGHYEPPHDDCNTVIAGAWTFYIDRHKSTATGHNDLTGEVRRDITMEELLEFYGSHN